MTPTMPLAALIACGAGVALLKDWGCREAQGYYFSRPMEADAVPAFLAGHQVGAGAA